MKANTKQLILLVFMLNTISLSTAVADEEVDVEFLKFLADMEEATGSGFDVWLNDDSEDHQYSLNKTEQKDMTEQQK